ncbi:MAG: hypothetical protein Q9191_008506, partial [Dirinaria sp. TL-2023a]
QLAKEIRSPFGHDKLAEKDTILPEGTTSSFGHIGFLLHLDSEKASVCLMMQSAMAASGNDRPYGFFDLPREIRDDIYTRIMSFHNVTSYITLAPKGKLPTYMCKPSDHRAGMYKQYQEFVNFFTISRHFRDEALPIFWQRNRFEISRSFSLISMPRLLDKADTTLDYIGPSGKIHITSIEIHLLCTVFVKQPRGSKKNREFDTDLGITIKGLLDMMPNLQSLRLPFSCSVEREDYPGEDKTHAVLEEAAASLLDFLHPMECFESSDPPKLVIYLFGSVVGRPVRAPTDQETVVG